MGSASTRQEPFNITSEQHGHAAHLRISGEIDIATVSTLEGWLHTVESNGNSAIVLDLEAVTFMDCSALNVFLGAADRASRSGRTFSLVRAPALVRRVLRITDNTHLLGADALGPSISE